MKKNDIIIGTRGSKLALWQANFVKNEIEKKIPGIPIQIKIIKTEGDKVLDSPLFKIGGKGIFVKEIEHALIENSIDIAVHSVKDLPTEIPSGLKLAAVLERADPRDVLISKGDVELTDLPKGCTLLTGSLRRRNQILLFRSDIKFQEIRGNIDTRFRKFYQSPYDGMILAKAGIERMGFENKISEVFSEDICLPAAGQGAIGIETRENDDSISEIAGTLNHENSMLSIKAERAFLTGLGGGCQIPIGSIAKVINDNIVIKGVLCDLDGRKIIRDKISGNLSDAEDLGKQLSERIINKGGKKIILDFEKLNYST